MIGPLLLLGLQVNLLTPSETVDRLVTDLALDKVPDLQLNEPIAVTASSSHRELLERVVGRLRAVGAKSVFMITGVESPPRAARDRGARWLLELERTPDTVQARLRQVDDGLWRPPSTGIFASALIAVSPLPSGPTAPAGRDGPEAVGPNPPAGLYGPTKTLGDVPGEPLALATCPTTPATLIVLTRSALYRVQLDEPARVQAELQLNTLARSPMPSRFPLGIAHCREEVVAFATSDLAGGHEVDAITLKPRRLLGGSPVAFENGDWVVAQPHEGRPQWRAPNDVFVWSHLAGRTDVALVAEGAIHRNGTVLSPSGLGATAIMVEEQLIWVRTGLGPWGGPDEVQLGTDNRPLGDVVPLPSPVRASTLGRFFGPAWSLIIALPTEGRTSLQALRVVLP